MFFAYYFAYLAYLAYFNAYSAYSLRVYLRIYLCILCILPILPILPILHILHIIFIFDCKVLCSLSLSDDILCILHCIFSRVGGAKYKIKMPLCTQKLKRLEPRTSWSPAQRSANQATESHNSKVAMEQWGKKRLFIRLLDYCFVPHERAKLLT